MDSGLKNRFSFIAGASSGLGHAVAQRLAAEGSRVAMCSRSTERIAAAAARIRETTALAEDSVLPVTCDVTDEEQIKRAFEEVRERFGALHVLVTNAGGPPAGFIGDFEADDWRNALELNLISTINLCRHALPLLREAAANDGHARIIMMTSISAKEPIPNLYLSNAARAGVQGFAKSLAYELGPEGITVNTVLPGYTRTQRLAELADAAGSRTGQPPDEIERGWAENTALKRIGEVEEFASAVLFLASAGASYITGVALPVDGGRARGLL